jgi:hypothetical protein
MFHDMLTSEICHLVIRVIDQQASRALIDVGK